MCELSFIRREIFDDDATEISYCATILDESFDHEFGTEVVKTVVQDDDCEVYVNDEVVKALSPEHQALVDLDIENITLKDFEYDEFL